MDEKKETKYKELSDYEKAVEQMKSYVRENEKQN